MKIKPSSYFLIVLLLLMLTGISISLTYVSIESKLLPLIVCSIVFILGAIELRKELAATIKVKIAVEEPSREVKGRDELRRFGYAWFWVIGFFLCIYLLGFLIATALLVFSYLKLHGRGWLVAISVAVLTTAFVYGIFEVVLKVFLYKGLIFS